MGVTLLKKDKEGTFQLAKTVLVESVLVYALKQVIDRQRPNGGHFSFPSGHTAVSFTSAAFLYKRYGWQYGIPASIMASFVGYSRFGIDEPVHYFTDVMAGALIGIGTSLLFTTKHIDGNSISVSGGWGSSGFMVSAKVKF